MGKNLLKMPKPLLTWGNGNIGYVHIDEISTNPWRLLVPVMQAYGGGSWNSDGTTCLMNSAESVEAVTLIHIMMYVDNSVVKPNEKVDFTSGTVGYDNAPIELAQFLKRCHF